MNYFDSDQYIKNYSDKLKLTKESAQFHFKKYGQFNGFTDQKDYKTYKITVITPCSRPENLLKLKDSLNFDYINQWIIVHDTDKPLKIFEEEYIFEYSFKAPGKVGNAQRNYALSLIKNKESYIYFLDDDNIIHPDLYKLTLLPNKIYTFDQIYKNNKIRLTGYRIRVGSIDTAMFLVWFPMVEGIKWDIDKYDADGYYISECFSQNRDKLIYINKSLCYYNYLNDNV